MKYTLMILIVVFLSGHGVAQEKSIHTAKENSAMTYIKKDFALFSVFHDVGVFDFFVGGEEQLENATMLLNDIPVLKGATYKANRQEVLFENTVDGIFVTGKFSIQNDHWLAVDITISNPTKQPKTIKQFAYMQCDYSMWFSEAVLKSLRFFANESFEWRGGGGTSIELKEDTVCLGSDVNALFSNTITPSCTLGFPLSGRWHNRVKVDVAQHQITAFVDFKNRPFTVMPGGSVELDRFVVAGGLTLEKSLSAFASFVRPRPIRQVKPTRNFTIHTQELPDTLLNSSTNEATIKRLLTQVKALRTSGARCIQTNGLLNDTTLSKPVSFETFSRMRDVYASLREAMGQEMLWISDESNRWVTAGLVDVFVFDASMPNTQNDILARVRRHAKNFWLKDCYGQMVLATLSDTELTDEQLRAWCTYLIVSGTMVLSDKTIDNTTKLHQSIISTTLENASGVTGRPLDFEKNELPEIWVREENSKTYVGVFNWGSEEKTFTIDYKSVNALIKGRIVHNIFSNKDIPATDGSLTLTLQPFESFCGSISHSNLLTP